MLASLDHSMYFYNDDLQVDDWCVRVRSRRHEDRPFDLFCFCFCRMLFYMQSPVTKNGRGLVQGRIYKRDGSLAVVCVQEGVVRAGL